MRHLAIKIAEIKSLPIIMRRHDKRHYAAESQSLAAVEAEGLFTLCRQGLKVRLNSNSPKLIA
jgi:hypothetical protein